MTDIELLGAQWKEAAALLGIKCVAPFDLKAPTGASFRFACLLPEFGAPHGMLLAVVHNPDATKEAAAQGYGYTSMAPEKRRPFEIESYKECLEDWGWMEQATAAPAWYSERQAD